MIVVETDNALGSPSGDIDDGFALMAMLSRESEFQEDVQVFSTFGNTSSNEAYRNSRELFSKFNSHIDLQNGVSKPNEVFPVEKLKNRNVKRWIALGPLTGVYSALEQGVVVDEVFVVGAHNRPKGFMPPIWPMEFNLVKDIRATHGLLNSNIVIRIFCLDIIRQLRSSLRDLREQLPSTLFDSYGASIKRWSLRNRLMLRSSFSLWDLAAIEFLFHPQYFSFEDGGVLPSNKMGWAVVENGKKAHILRKIDVSGVLSGFFDTLNSKKLL